MKIRLSVGSAVHMGLRSAKMFAAPTTLYMMLGDTCLGACRFCTQARTSDANRKFLSRVAWPPYPLDAVLAHLDSVEKIGRICIQTLKYAELLPDLVALVTHIKKASTLPISICMNPAERHWLVKLKAAGAERIGVGLDCATPESFARIKPGFSWTRYLSFIDELAELFEGGSVHLIVGLGDTDRAILERVQSFVDMGTQTALFAFTPVRGTRLDFAPPPVERYRALQLARHLMVNHQATFDDMQFIQGQLAKIAVSPEIMCAALRSGAAFRTSGCPSCNRPMYNERPGGVMYNYPKALTAEEKCEAHAELLRYVTF